MQKWSCAKLCIAVFFIPVLQGSRMSSTTLFTDLALSEHVLTAIQKVGYEQPSPIQLAAIPILLAGGDIIGMAQTGTGKTAAFALPLLSRIDIKDRKSTRLNSSHVRISYAVFCL